MHHSNYDHCSAAALHYLDTHTLLNPDAFELVLHNFAFLFSLTDFGVSLVSLCCPLRLVCFLTCIAAHVCHACQPRHEHNISGSWSV